MLKLLKAFLKAYKKNYILLMIGIGFSSMLMLSLMQMGGIIKKGYKDALLECNKTDILINDLDQEKFLQLINVIDNEQIIIDDYYIEEEIGTVSFNNGMSVGSVVILKGDWDSYHVISFVEGVYPTTNNEIAIDQSYAELNLLKVGDTFKFEYYSGEQVITEELRISGIINSNINAMNDYYFVIPERTNLDKVVYRCAINVTNNFNGSVDEASAVITDVYLRMPQVLGIEPSYFYKNNIELLSENAELIENNKLLEDIGFSIMALNLVIGIAVFLFVLNSAYMNMYEMLQNLGILRCLGMNMCTIRKLLHRLLLLCSFVGILIGMVAGTLLNYIVARPLISNLLSQFYDLVIEVKQDWTEYILVLILIIAALELSHILVCNKIKRLTPIQVINYRELNDCLDQVNVRNMNRFSIYKIARRNLKRNKIRTKLLFTTMTFSMVLTLIITHSVMSLDFKSNINEKSKIAEYELYTNWFMGEYISKNKVDKLNESKKAVCYGMYYENDYICTLDNETTSDQNTSSTKLIVYDDLLMDELLKVHKNISKNDLIALLVVPPEAHSNSKEVIIQGNNVITEKYLKAKSNYKIELDGSIKNETFLSGLGVNNNNYYIIINENLANIIFGSKLDYTSVLVSLQDSEYTITEVLNYLDQDRIVSINKLFEQMNDAKKQLVTFMVIALYILITAILSTLSILLNAIRTNLINRKKEHAVLRAIGMTHKGLIKMLKAELLILMVKSIVLSTIISLPVNIWITQTMRETIQIHYFAYFFIPLLFITVNNLFIDVNTRNRKFYCIIENLEEE